MATNEDIINKLQSNWTTFKGLASSKLTDKRFGGIADLMESEEERIITCPASTRIDYHGAYPGGLVEHSLRVVKIMSDLNKTYGAELPSDSIVVCGLFHDFGKIGNEKHDYYVEKASDWHNRQGIMYETNQSLSSTAPALRSLWWLGRKGVALTEQEFLAIASIKDRSSRDDESVPVNGESMLSVILQQAVKVACLRGRGKNSVVEG